MDATLRTSSTGFCQCAGESIKLDALPPEILDLIFAEACTDDGRTGCALSLVSKTIRAASSRRVLDAVAIHGDTNMDAFAALLAQRPPEHRRVRHLFLTDRPRALLEPPPGQDRSEWLKTLNLRNPSFEHYHFEALVGCFRPRIALLPAVAPHLQTLTIAVFENHAHSVIDLSTTTFPALQELTVQSSFLAYRPLQCFYPIPTLRYLHIVQDAGVLFQEAMVDAISIFAPQLTHLRLSGMNGSRSSLIDFLNPLKRMVHRQAPTSQENPSDEDLATFLFTLERVIVQLSQPALHNCSSRLLWEISYIETARLLKSLAVGDARRRHVVLRPVVWNVAPTSDEDEIVALFLIKEYWSARVLGEEGPWAIHPDEIIDTNDMEVDGA